MEQSFLSTIGSFFFTILVVKAVLLSVKVHRVSFVLTYTYREQLLGKIIYYITNRRICLDMLNQSTFPLIDKKSSVFSVDIFNETKLSEQRVNLLGGSQKWMASESYL